MKRKLPRITAFLGEDTAFEGTLTFTGGLRIDGRFKGEISTEGTLTYREKRSDSGRYSCLLCSCEW